MIVRKFLAWSASAPADRRAAAAAALARAFLAGDLPVEEERDAETALTTILDDPSPLVRRALAEAIASAGNAPHHLVVALANDQSEVAAPVLGRSPRLTNADLIDCAAVGDAFAQAAIAMRAPLARPAAAAIAEVGRREAAMVLALNPKADIPDFSLRRMVERFGDDGEFREALLAREGLPAFLRADLVEATARALSRFVVACDWLSDERAARAAREAREKATIIIASDPDLPDADGPADLVRHLREQGHLTAGLVLRALLSGNRNLFEAALAELSGMDRARVQRLVADFGGGAFAALCRRASLPDKLVPAFRAALSAQAEIGFASDAAQQARLSRTMVERALTACERQEPAEAAAVIALLRRFDAEAAREDAREASASLRRAEELPRPAKPSVCIDLEALEAELLDAA